MKILGTIFLAICPIILGFLKSKTLKQSKQKIEKIIDLINRIIIEIKYKKTDLYCMFNGFSLEENFNQLEFLQNFKKNSYSTPFPEKWEKAIKNWQTPIPKECKLILKSFSTILGATECKGQILALKQAKFQFEEALKDAKKTYIKKGKIFRCLGTMFGILVFILLI